MHFVGLVSSNSDNARQERYKLYQTNQITLHTSLYCTSVTLANDQLEAQILIHLLQSSTCTCFEQYLAHPQEVKL